MRDLNKEFQLSYQNWINDKGEEKRYDYKLTSLSTVVDIGMYKGDFTEKIWNKFQCNIFGFEPIMLYFFEAYEKLHKKDLNNKKINLYNFGLSNRSGIEYICVNGDESSLYNFVTDQSIKITLVSFDKIFSGILNSVNIDLLKVNIELGEYDLIEHLIETGNIRMIINLQVQFHFFKNRFDNTRKNDKLIERKEIIYDKLKETHKITYDYPWIWTNFERLW